MVTVKIALDNFGIPIRVEARGHIDGEKKGENLACAAVSVLIKTAYTTLLDQRGLEIDAFAPEPGELVFNVRSYPVSARESSKGISGFLISGLKEVLQEYPGSIKLEITEI